MAYVVRFAAFAPPARDDGLPWTRLRIEEAAANTGPWTVLETKTLSPTDTDPKNPGTRNFTTELATLAAGWYRLTWLDAAGDTSPTSPLYNGANIAPSPREVADLMLSRLADDAGPVESFSTATSPTSDQVERFINYGLRRVRSKLGAVPEEVADDARHVVALYAAMLAESSLVPEQSNPTDGPYQRLRELFNDALADVKVAVQEVGAGEQVGAVDDRGLAVGLFPAPLLQFDREVF